MDFISNLIAKNTRPADLPEGFTSKEIVVKAIEFKSPPRIPYTFNTHGSDIAEVFNINSFKHVEKPEKMGETYVDCWGITWEVTGKIWDHAVGHPFQDKMNINECEFPVFDFLQPDEVTTALIQTAKQAGKYVLGINSINMFEHLRSLLGFEDHMIAPYVRPQFLKDLINKLVEMTCELIDGYQLNGDIDGFMTIEDWGLQKGLQINIEQFREYYKPAYKRIIDYCHSKGIHFFWHCCGDIIELLPEMVELGVDVVQLDQPRLMGYDAIIEATEGKLCCFNCLDIQWSVADDISHEDIINETKHMIAKYKEKMSIGGFIMKHYSQPEDIELSRDREEAIAEAFFDVNTY